MSKPLDHRRVPPEGLFRRLRLYLVDEAPGAAEAAQGKPFVGPAGNVLRKMLGEAGIDLGQLRLANAIPFRPIEHSKDCKPSNRSPTTEEIQCYGVAALTDIRRSRPAVIVALGSTAARLFGATVHSSGPARQSSNLRAIRCASLSTQPTSAASAAGAATLGVRWPLTYAKLGKKLGLTQIQEALEALDEPVAGACIMTP